MTEDPSGSGSLDARQAGVAAVPSTSAQRARYNRVLETATRFLSAGGEDNLQMKELAKSAEISLTALYRYFPSKDHVLLAVSLARYERALQLIQQEAHREGTARELVTDHLLREFHAQQRDRNLTAALTRALAGVNGSQGPIIQQIADLHLRILSHVAEADPGLSEDQLHVLPMIVDIFSAALRRWLADSSTDAEVRYRIRVGCHLLDLNSSVLAAEMVAATEPSQVGSP
ncbi:TetR/AcrR family transcriptional regulator [Rhodococcus sp. NPDC059968]|uniref:TetR/AcrR family transcriptional regulator n=1 Tax=Rhodococcus sp. NPDC059968 TaxID=3347017 RepID=UPI00366E6610